MTPPTIIAKCMIARYGGGFSWENIRHADHAGDCVVGFWCGGRGGGSGVTGCNASAFVDFILVSVCNGAEDYFWVPVEIEEEGPSCSGRASKDGYD